MQLTEINPLMADIPIMQFYPKDSLNRDFSNFWAPNLKCMELMLEEANFKVTSRKVLGMRSILKCTIAHDEMLEYQKKIAKGKILPKKS